MLSFCLLIVALMLSGIQAAWAEGGCPPGKYPQQGNVGWTCARLPVRQEPSYSDADPPSSNDRWGAIAITHAGQLIGQSAEKFSEMQASQAAVSNCRARGGTGCRTLRTYRNQCVALAANDRGTRFALGASEGEAMGAAMDQCFQQGGRLACYPSYAECSLPPRTM